MNLYIVYYGEPNQSPVGIPIACEVNLVADWTSALHKQDCTRTILVVKDQNGRGKEIAAFEIALIRAIVDEGERVYGTNIVNRDTKLRFEAQTVRLVK